MFRFILLVISLVMFVGHVKSQISEEGVPYSLSLAGLKSTVSLPQVSLQKLDIKKFLEEEPSGPGPLRIGVYKDTILDVKVLGKKDIIPGKGRIWRLKIANENARSLQIVFKTFIIPRGARLFLYNDDLSKQAGAFTKNNMRKDSAFVLADFKGNHVIVEYFEPDNPEFDGQLVIGSVGQAFKELANTESLSNFININCPLGKDAQLAKHAVSYMIFRSGNYEAYCTGSLINNAKVKGIPYFLTANHCLSTQTEASSLVTYYNYEIIGCDGDTAVNHTLSGANLLSTSMPSDYTLLLLNDMPPNTYQPFYAGWVIADSAPEMVTGVHNPYLHTKKISIDYDSIYTNTGIISWKDDTESPAYSHWIVSFDEGKTSGGSSGSPLFNSKNQIIGQLHGGGDNYELYGKLSYSYTHKPSKYQAIGSFLDPDSSGIEVLDGYIPADNPPDAFFTAESDLVCLNTPVLFKDYSVFGPYERKWTITPSTFTYLDFTSDTSANPIIEFHEDEFYTVNLDLFIAGVKKSTESKIIKAGNAIDVNIKTRNPHEMCDCDFNSIQYTASGANDYSWSLPVEDEGKFELNKNTGDTVVLSRASGFKATAGYTITLTAIGTLATCVDTNQLSLSIIKPANDEVVNAILLNYGRSLVFSNVCATTEEGEPVPPFTSCTSQLSWCDECLTGEGILQNSVWFKFIPDETGKISISSSGFDNEIALYYADSYLGILNDDNTLLAANDDRSTSNPSPLIKSQLVESGRPYWIQVDGSACGLVDDFYLTINKVISTNDQENSASNIIVYPQPATDHLVLKGDELIASPVILSVYGISGQHVLSKEAEVNNGEITLDISFLDAGIYLVKINTGVKLYISRIIKY